MATKKDSAGGFSQMPKMMTDEPSVILKMKKGGHVHSKHKAKEEHGHKSMHHMAHGGHAKHHEVMEAEHGASPKKPSMHERKKAMSASLMKKGGKVVHKADGGMMGAPMANPQMMAAMANPAIRQALARRAMAQRAMAGAPAGLQPGMKKGGMAKGGDMAQDKAMIKKAFKEHDAQEHKGGKGTHLKLKSGGGLQKKAEAFETMTTIENDEKPYVRTEMHDGDKTDRRHGTKGIKEANAGGYKHGGHAHKKHHYAAGGTIEGNEGKFVKTEMHDGDKADKAHGTGGIRVSNAGGFKHGGKAKHHYAHGGTVPEGDWEHRPANGTPKGVVNTKTGEVKEANAGGYKHGGKASKKAYATGGSVNDAGRPVAYPERPRARPVVNTAQSGTFKHGGKVRRFEDGGDAVVAREQARRKAEQAQDKADNEKLRNQVLDVPRSMYNGVKNFINDNFAPSGSYGRTDKNSAPAPAQKRGGSVKK
jgi:hypothetical protein